MELSHDFIVPASVDQAWETFMDLERVGGCFPGAQVTSATADGFSGTVKVKLGPIALQYAGSGSFLERDDAAHRAVIEAKGKDKRGNGTAGATVTLQLAPSGEGTRVDVTTELSITGKPAQFGRGVMQDVSDKLLQQFVGCIESQFAPAEAEAEPVVEAAAEAPAGTEAATSAGAAPAAAAQAPAPAPAAHRPPPAAADDSIDLGATVLPVLIKSYAPHVIGALLAIALGFFLGRRSRRR